MTRREFAVLLAAAANEQSRALIRQLYARPNRGEGDRAAKLAPVAPKAPKKRRKFGEITQV